MRKTIILYALSLALLVFFLKFLEYRYFSRDLKLEFYLGIVAILFTALGALAGLELNRNKKRKPDISQKIPEPFTVNEELLRKSGISKRELEVLELMAMGFSNQEIADKLFISLNTVKTHTSNLFVKLNVSRRIQAIQKAQEMQFIP